MAKVLFNYKGVEKEIQCNINYKINDIFKRYANKVGIDLSEIYFIYNGNIIDENLYLNEIINEEDKREIL